VGWVALLILGFGGFAEQSDDGDLGRTSLDNLYLTAQLSTLEYDGGLTYMNWRLEIARFVIPLLAAATVLQTASVVFREQFLRWRIATFKDHVIVCGLGTAGSRLAIALDDEGHRVVGVDADPTSPGMATLRDHGIPCLEGDATDAAVLQALRGDRAARVVALCATDAQNVSVTTAARALPRKGGRPALRCSVHLTDSELTELLRGAELGGTDEVRVEFFNLHERAARALLGEHLPFGDGSRPPHVVILGLGQLGRSLAVAAAQQWVDVGEGPLPMTLVDREARGRWQALLLQHPAMASAVAVNALELDLESPGEETLTQFLEVLTVRRPTMVAVAFEDESLALSSALMAHKALGDPSVPVVVRTETEAGLGRIIMPTGSGSAHHRFAGLHVFPFVDRACSPAIIEGGVREQLARAMHEEHTARTGSGEGLHRSWEQLADHERESSRRAADGTVDALDQLGFDIVPLRHWGAPQITFTADELDRFAQLEHERWKAEREADGWSYGATRDDALKKNPLLVPWDELSPADQAQNRAGIEAMPALLARGGFELARE
jgi:Trk K+ transport system NAD-binding subunit